METTIESRCYGWKEIACLYSPTLTPESAPKRLKRWVAFNPSLAANLKAEGWRKGNKILTPGQVRVLLRYLGEP